MKLRNLARNTLFMAYFNAITMAAVYASWHLLQGGPLLGWLGVLLTTAPLVAYVSYALLTLRVARTSERLPLIGAQAVLGVAVASYGLLIAPTEWLQPVLAGAFLLGFIWYAYSFAGFLGARPSPRLAPGQRLPDFVLRDAQGQAVTSAYLFKQPMVLIFYRGNWCPFCMAQVKELAQRYRDIEGLGAWAAEIQARAGASCGAKLDAGEALDRPQQRAGNDEWPRKSPRPEGLDPERGRSSVAPLVRGPTPDGASRLASPPFRGQRGPGFLPPTLLVAGIAFISPQRQAKSAALSQRFAIPARFLVDDGNTLARQLGIDSPCGIPTGLQALGYDSDTVMPTVVITAPGGRILWADETDNYRVRPEPGTYLEVLRREGLVAA